jgi:hypothetical protein
MKKKPTKVVRLSAHAKLCRDLPIEGSSLARALDYVLARLKALKVPPIERLGPAPSAESIVAEIRAQAAARRLQRQKAREGRSMDSFVIYAWPRVSSATRALLCADPCSDQHGDLGARALARSLRDTLNPLDFESFLDEIVRS